MSQNYTTQARDENAGTEKEGTIQTAADEQGDTDLYGKVTRGVADRLGEFFSITLSEEADVMAERVGRSGSNDDGNFGKFETPAGAAYGIGIHRSVAEEVTGDEFPEAIGIKFASSDEEAYEGALDQMDEDAEEEAEALIAGGADDESDDEPQEVGISDEELALTDD